MPTNVCPGVCHAWYWASGAWGLRIQETGGHAELILLSLRHRHRNLVNLQQNRFARGLAGGRSVGCSFGLDLASLGIRFFGGRIFAVDMLGHLIEECLLSRCIYFMLACVEGRSISPTAHTSASFDAVEDVLSRGENGLEARPVEFNVHDEDSADWHEIDCRAAVLMAMAEVVNFAFPAVDVKAGASTRQRDAPKILTNLATNDEIL